MTREQIDEACRQLVREDILTAWYSFMWWHGRHWVLCPPVGKSIGPLNRTETIDKVTELAA